MSSVGKQNADEILAENALLKETISKLENRIEALGRNEKIYLEALSLAKKKQFGSSSEKTPQPQYEELGFFNEAEQEYTDKPVEPIVKTPQGIKKKEPKSGREKLIDKNLIETKIVNCTLSADKRICPVCGEEMREMGKEFIRESVQLILFFDRKPYKNQAQILRIWILRRFFYQVFRRRIVLSLQSL